ncbi:uroporphyrinogen-III synthase [Roseibium sp. Sym1]|uniref:uroporphyrinogen-III synthase n=1 Tax=Roseibium sp. Sym1 TaxID=3016006 RepID=UPI0022B41005|nr:uroporphyrinogen-III synthase [Roseibium sp. Sym1]
MRFLVTRPQPECRRTAERLRALGHAAEEVPLLTCTEYPPDRFDLSNVSALAISSRRAVAVLAGHGQLADLQKLPVFTVGRATAEAARKAGFAEVVSADGDLAALAELILARRDGLEPGSVLYPAAEDRAGELDEVLAGGKMSCRTVAVYRMVPVETVPQELIEALSGEAYDGVLIYSKRTAEALRSLLRAGVPGDKFSRMPVYALSKQAGEPLSEAMRVKVASAPNENALLELALTQC